jgi:hypothetical protein
MGTSKERVDTRADDTGPPAGVAVLRLALERIHAHGVALGLNAERLEKARASMSVEFVWRFACAAPLLGIYEGAGIELITASVDSVDRDRGN